MNAISKLFAILIAVLLLYVYPASEASERQDDLSALVAHGAAVQFVDAVRSKGYITPTMYNEFERTLASTGNLYDVELEHLHKKYDPVYTNPTDPGTFQNEFEVHYDGFYSAEVKAILFPDNTWDQRDSRRRYKLTAGDFFTVKVANRNRTQGTLIRDWLNGSNTGNAAVITANYGGMVLNEDY
ncbi:hypothetical protein MH117_17255 [Paenibacillus sp. ACRRX]|uniref:hypothetical protein n=1 Tax=unclassified Paenibacillus TaxID=185978 RepID=UPI001EF5E962|nr:MULTISPECIES: hypothetical protein [unclassified Paenibacillus]MCG7409167.1 hypothetical protein [Paenibacillus sp. ACRRX]MDK8181839.1 hypothetical protein [Paenibacillus sp. UMB4589-SE434]